MCVVCGKSVCACEVIGWGLDMGDGNLVEARFVGGERKRLV